MFRITMYVEENIDDTMRTIYLTKKMCEDEELKNLAYDLYCQLEKFIKNKND